MKILFIGKPEHYQGIVDRLNQSKVSGTFGIDETMPKTGVYDFLIDLSQPSPALAQARENRHSCYIELAVELYPKASELGYICYVGGHPCQIERLKPYLDQLSHLPNAWLYCGPVGAATFCHQVIQTLHHLGIFSSSSSFANTIPLEDYAKQTYTIVQQLNLLTQRYLASYSPSSPLSNFTDIGFPIPADFSHTSHYSLALAQWLHATLTRFQSFSV